MIDYDITIVRLRICILKIPFAVPPEILRHPAYLPPVAFENTTALLNLTSTHP